MYVCVSRHPCAGEPTRGHEVHQETKWMHRLSHLCMYTYTYIQKHEEILLEAMQRAEKSNRYIDYLTYA